MIAELYGRHGRRLEGKARLDAPRRPEVGLMGSSAVVAQHDPARGRRRPTRFKRRGSERLVVAVFGDGATEEGVYHESLNFAAAA